MIKKHQILGLALFAVFAFSAVIASAAFAEESLPAVWLLNGAAVTAATATKSTGTLLLEDTATIAGKVAVTCAGTLDGTVNTAGKDTVTALLNASGVEVTLAAKNFLTCTNQTNCGGTPEVYAEGFPWGTQLDLLEPSGKFQDLLTTTAVYDVTCTILGIKVTDECTAPIGTSTSVENGAADVVLTAGAIAEPHASCTAGSSTSGVIQTVEALTATETGTLQASE
jgi:hypothetical protein